MDQTAGLSPRLLTRVDIEVGLRELGLARGDAAEVHSSLSRFGWVEGGAEAVVDALMSVVGAEGALVMSAQPVTLPLPLSDEEKARGIIAKVRFLAPDSDERTGMGAIADAFRRRPGVVLGTGLHRLCAWGRNAALYSQGYRHLVDADEWTLLLGVDIHRCSSMHVAEGRVGLPAPVKALSEVPADILRDYPADRWYIQYGEPPDDAWGKVQAAAERRGLVRRRIIGAAECMLFRTRAVVEIYEDALRKDPLGLFGLRHAEA